jgi:hypothetical protein
MKIFDEEIADLEAVADLEEIADFYENVAPREIQRWATDLRIIVNRAEALAAKLWRIGGGKT